MTTTTHEVKHLASTALGDVVVCGGVIYTLSSCCKASFTGTEGGVACRACYQLHNRTPGAGWGALVGDEAGERQLADMLASSVGPFAAEAARLIFAQASA